MHACVHVYVHIFVRLHMCMCMCMVECYPMEELYLSSLEEARITWNSCLLKYKEVPKSNLKYSVWNKTIAVQDDSALARIRLMRPSGFSILTSVVVHNTTVIYWGPFFFRASYLFVDFQDGCNEEILFSAGENSG